MVLKSRICDNMTRIYRRFFFVARLRLGCLCDEELAALWSASMIAMDSAFLEERFDRLLVFIML